MRIAGALLLVAAAFLYAHDLRAGRRRASGANAVRYVAGASVLGLGLRAVPDDSSADRPIYEPCSPEIASNILARLAEAEPVKRPVIDDAERSYDLFLFLTNRTRVFLRARRAPGSDTAFVSLREPRRNAGFGAKEESVSFVEFPPAGVKGLGRVFDEIDSGALASLRGARLVAPPSVRAWTNLVRRAGVAGLTEESLAATWSAIRAIAASGEATGAGVSKGSMTGPERPELRPVPPEGLTAILAALAGAEDADAPSGAIEGEEYGLLLVLDGGHAVNMRAAVADSAPDDALVGFVDAAPPGRDGGAPRLAVTPPARVPGLGRLLRDAAAKPEN